MSSLFTNSAMISDCGRYRYQLQRRLDPLLAACNEQTCLFIMLNPSTADGLQDDPTLNRCKGFAKAWGFGRLEVVNLFSLRATDPKQLQTADCIKGPDHWQQVLNAIDRASLVVCGWGADKAVGTHGKQMFDIIRKAGKIPMCLGATQAGHPRHPLYLRAGLMPHPMEARP